MLIIPFSWGSQLGGQHCTINPYYMRESQLAKLAGWNAASEYLSGVMTSNIGKDLLLAYFPE
jgi:hypothetical protein